MRAGFAGRGVLNDPVLETAAAWFASLRSDEATPADHARWQHWLDAAPAHRAAWEKIDAVNRHFGMLPAGPALAALKTPPPRRAMAKKLLMLTGAVAIGALSMRRETRDELAALAAGERTAVGEVRQLALADGSALWVNTDSALDIDFSPSLRRVVLHRGEILIRSSKDTAHTARPLVVDVTGARLTALETRFNVHRHDEEMSLSVFDGAVRVDLATGATRVARAGTRVRIGQHGIGVDEVADETLAAWTRKRLSVERMRLDDFVANLARYRHGHLACDPVVAGLLLTGSYPLDDTDRILAALQKTLPVRVRQVLPWWTTLEPA